MMRISYKIKEEKGKELREKYRQDWLSEEIGVHYSYISYILSGRKSCSKKVAYCITKVDNPEAEILDYFDIVEV